MKRVIQKVSKEVWEAARDNERPENFHPCEHHDPDFCFCKGSCSCHWVQWLEETFSFQINEEGTQ